MPRGMERCEAVWSGVEWSVFGQLARHGDMAIRTYGGIAGGFTKMTREARLGQAFGLGEDEIGRAWVR